MTYPFRNLSTVGLKNTDVLGFQIKIAARCLSLLALFFSLSIVEAQSVEVDNINIKTQDVFPEVLKSVAVGSDNGEMVNKNLSYSHQDSVTLITVDYFRNELPNPVQFSYDYFMEKGSNGDTHIDIKAVLDPLNFYCAESVDVKYSGSRLKYPANMQVGLELNDVFGLYTYSFRDQKDLFIRTHWNISNRSVIGYKENFDNGNINVFVIKSFVEMKKVIGNEVELDVSLLYEWYNPSIGIVKSILLDPKVSDVELKNLNLKNGTVVTTINYCKN